MGDDDRHLWLEDGDDARVGAWVTQHNEATLGELTGRRFEVMRTEALEILEADTHIPFVSRQGDYLYNFWQDAAHPRGLWRRTTLEEYRKDAPEWDVLIDVDALAEAEGENWIFGGAGVNAPTYRRAVVALSRGGSDASVVREFDMQTRQFAADGFNLPEAKSELDFEDDDTVLVSTDFGPGSLTESGYPRIVKRWRRGADLATAEVVFEADVTDVGIGMSVSSEPGWERTHIFRMVDFYRKDVYEMRDGELLRIDVPTDASFAVHRDWAMVLLVSDWVRGETTYRADSVLITKYDDLLAGTAEFTVVFDPDGTEFLAGGAFTGGKFLSVKLRDVATVVEVVTPGTWTFEPLLGVPENATVTLAAFDPLGDEIFVSATSFDKPSRLLHGKSAGPITEIKSAPEFFDADDLVVAQHFATSDDGTRVPYFLVSHRDADGPGPVLLDGYGAFRSAQLPSYYPVLGKLWFERGGSYALANIRGGGEYGQAWHEQTVLAGRHLVAEDFAAVATDLVELGVTTPQRLGAMGGSAGGLLMGVMLTKYPERFGALVCQNPLLDMRRYHQLLAGASWVAEFGDPDDPAQWEFIAEYSPYHNISAERAYPPILITTSTNDDRVHPGHARKMAAALEAAGHRVYYYENTEGGHAGAANDKQVAFERALRYEFLLRTLSG